MERLPPEITTNILSRLDFKSSLECKCVSKPWCKILSHPTFRSIQFSQISTVSPDIFLHFKAVSSHFGSRMFYLEDNQALNKRPLKPFSMLDEDFLYKRFQGDYPTILGSCNGLICLLNPIRFIFDMKTGIAPQNPIYVFNPITEQQSKLPPFTIPKLNIHYEDEKSDKWLCGFGFDDLGKVFKMVLIVFVGVDYEAQAFKNQVQVHTLGSTSWRTKHDIVPNVLRRSREIVSSAFINSHLHWLTFDEGPLIVSFHMRLEEFGYVPTPDANALKNSHKDYQLGLLGECLCLVECSPYAFINIWAMKKYNDRESWVKQISIEDPSCHTAKLIKFRRNCELLLLLDDMYMVGYNTRNQKRRVLPLGWDKKKKRYELNAYPLVGSLIALKSAIGVPNDTKENTSVDVNK